MPNLIGISHDAAVAGLRQERLQVGSVKSRPADRSQGTVIEQEPTAGSRLAPGAEVHLVLAEKPLEPGKSPEPEAVTMAVPKLLGLSQENAQATLKRACLVTGKIKRVESREAKPGTVIEQIPSAGQPIVKGKAVTLVVSIEPPTPMLVTVPKLGGLTVAMARESIAKAGLTSGAVHKKVNERIRPGIVIDQKPGAGQQVQKGTAVELLMAVSAAETGPVAGATPGKVTLIALGEPTSKRVWGGEKKPAYSTKMARLFSGILKESASASSKLSIDMNSDLEIRVLEKMLREGKRLCESTGSAIVLAATTQEPYASSEAESAFWPELHLTAIDCNNGKHYTQRYSLSPGRTDVFPFENAMAESMRKFAREYRNLLK